jgi:small subunit ribosomal protein S6
MVPRRMSLYELTLILDPEAPLERRNEILDGVRSAVEAGGTIHGAHDWGVRRLAFEIDHRADGHYHLLQIEAPPELLERLDRTLKITDGVLRFRFIRVRPGVGASSSPAQREAARRDDGRPELPAQVAARAAADAPPRGEGG